MNDEFFTQENCDRCGKKLLARIMSWFNNQTICLKCSAKEDDLKQQLKDAGKNPSDYEGCGYPKDVR